MGKVGMVSILLGLVLSLSGYAFAERVAESKPQTHCPVHEKMKIDKDIYVDYEGKRIYFCCPWCPPKFKENPAKYMKKLEEWGVTPEDAPTQTPDSGHEHDSMQGGVSERSTSNNEVVEGDGKRHFRELKSIGSEKRGHPHVRPSECVILHKKKGVMS
jgi:YHS domain-containing protein